MSAPKDRIKRDYRFSTVPEHLIRDATVSDRAFRLWCVLDRYAGADGQAFPSRKRLAETDLHCSLATLDRVLAELTESGWLSKERREAGGSNEYTLHVLPSKKAQVRSTPDLTGEATPPGLTDEATPVLTGEGTLASPVTRPSLTHDAHKEESPKEDASKGDSDSSLRSSSADDGQEALIHIEPNEPVLRFSKRARLPDNFAVTKGMREWFVGMGFQHVDGKAETDLFLNHHRARGTVMLDWVQAWQEWMRKAERYNAPRGVDRSNVRRLANVHHAPDDDPDVQRRIDAFNGVRSESNG